MASQLNVSLCKLLVKKTEEFSLRFDNLGGKESIKK